jgi:hypothetical protein
MEIVKAEGPIVFKDCTFLDNKGKGLTLNAYRLQHNSERLYEPRLQCLLLQLQVQELGVGS